MICMYVFVRFVFLFTYSLIRLFLVLNRYRYRNYIYRYNILQKASNKFQTRGVLVAWGFGVLTMWLQHPWLELSLLSLLISCHKKIIEKKQTPQKTRPALSLLQLFSAGCGGVATLVYPFFSFTPSLSSLPLIFSSFSSLSPHAAFVMPISPRHTIDTWGLQLCHYKSDEGNEEGREKMKVRDMDKTCDGVFQCSCCLWSPLFLLTVYHCHYCYWSDLSLKIR